MPSASRSHGPCAANLGRCIKPPPRPDACLNIGKIMRRPPPNLPVDPPSEPVKVPLKPAALALLLLCAGAPQAYAQAAPAPAAAAAAESFVTRHTGTFNGQKVKYVAVSTTMSPVTHQMGRMNQLVISKKAPASA